MNTLDLLEIPADFAARVRAVPGLPQRLVHFLHLEVAQHEERQKHYSPGTLALVQRAKEQAESRKTEGFDREKTMDELAENLLRLTAKGES